MAANIEQFALQYLQSNNQKGQQSSFDEIYKKLIDENLIQENLPAQSDAKQKNAYSTNGQRYYEKMKDYLNELKNKIDSRKWVVIVSSFIHNFFSSQQDVDARQQASTVKRNTTQLGKVQAVSDQNVQDSIALKYIRDIAQDIQGDPIIIDGLLAFNVNGKIVYPSKSTKKNKSKQLQSKIDYLKYINQSKKIDKKFDKNRKNPQRRFLKAYAKSITRKVNQNGLLNKAIKRMDPAQYEKYKNDQEIASAMAQTNMDNLIQGVSNGRVQLLQKAYENYDYKNFTFQDESLPVQTIPRRINPIQPTGEKKKIGPYNYAQIKELVITGSRLPEEIIRLLNLIKYNKDEAGLRQQRFVKYLINEIQRQESVPDAAQYDIIAQGFV